MPRLTPSLVILADDLSGAADCGIVCTQAGLDTLVVLGDRPDAAYADVLSIDADTRGRSEVEAVAETARLTRRYAAQGQLLYKKLDSTLRGHVGPELAATLRTRREAGPACIVMAPAFPAAGRTTVRGMQLLHGTPLERTEMWQREGVQHSAHIPEMLHRAGLRTAHVALSQVRRPGLPGVVAACRGHDAVVCDAETEADLQAIASASIPLGPGTVWAGSAGLARYLPVAAGIARTPRPATVPPVDGPILFVVGSLSHVSREQVAHLELGAAIRRVTVPAAILRAGPQHPQWAAVDRALDQAIRSGQDVVAVLGSGAQIDLAEGLRLCRGLARMVAPHGPRIGALVSTGGETARAVLQAFNASGLRLMGEIEPGVPLSTAEGIHHLPVVTKAGAFGTRGTLVRCRAILRRGTTAFEPSPEINRP